MYAPVPCPSAIRPSAALPFPKLSSISLEEVALHCLHQSVPQAPTSLVIPICLPEYLRNHGLEWRQLVLGRLCVVHELFVLSLYSCVCLRVGGYAVTGR